MMEEIDKDVKRTFPHLHFFNKDGAVGCTKHYEALNRILFIYAKLNPGIKYVQGIFYLYFFFFLDYFIYCDFFYFRNE